MATVVPTLTNAAGNTTLLAVIPATGPSDPKTADLDRAIRHLGGTATGSSIEVTGLTALNIDISGRLRSALLPYLGIVVGLAFLLLMLVFRSLLVPLTAAVGFLLSISATLGAVVAVFQWGWLAHLVRVDQTGPLISFLPIMVTGIVFGLAMDYQVFLVTRMREEHAHGTPARQAVITGFSHGARVVTAAAIIMISVFAGRLHVPRTAPDPRITLPVVITCLDDLHARALASGALLPRDVRWRMRRAALIPFVLLLLGLAGLVAGISAHRPVGILVAELPVVLLATLVLLCPHVCCPASTAASHSSPPAVCVVDARARHQGARSPRSLACPPSVVPTRDMTADDQPAGDVEPTQEQRRLREYLLRRNENLDRVGFDLVDGMNVTEIHVTDPRRSRGSAVTTTLHETIRCETSASARRQSGEHRPAAPERWLPAPAPGHAARSRGPRRCHPSRASTRLT